MKLHVFIKMADAQLDPIDIFEIEDLKNIIVRQRLNLPNQNDMNTKEKLVNVINFNFLFNII